MPPPPLAKSDPRKNKLRFQGVTLTQFLRVGLCAGCLPREAYGVRAACCRFRNPITPETPTPPAKPKRRHRPCKNKFQFQGAIPTKCLRVGWCSGTRPRETVYARPKRFRGCRFRTPSAPESAETTRARQAKSKRCRCLRVGSCMDPLVSSNKLTPRTTRWPGTPAILKGLCIPAQGCGRWRGATLGEQSKNVCALQGRRPIHPAYAFPLNTIPLP